MKLFDKVFAPIVDVIHILFIAFLCLILLPFVLVYLLVVWMTGTPMHFSVNDKRVATLRWFKFTRY